MLTGVFGTGALIQTDINLILQVVMFIAIVVGLVYKSKRKFKMHAILMGVAVILHIATFFAVMMPSFNTNYEYFVSATAELGVQTMWIHAIPGAVSMIIAVYLVVAWALRPANMAACSKRKRLMDIVTLLWLISLVFGIASYIIYYV